MLSDILRKKIPTQGVVHQAANQHRYPPAADYRQRASTENMYQHYDVRASTQTTLKQDRIGEQIPHSSILVGSPPHQHRNQGNHGAGIRTSTNNMRVSTGGSSKLDTIKAFVEQANRN